MYGAIKSSNSGIASQPEHIVIAEKIAAEIMDRFHPLEQNEAIKHAFNIIKLRRLERLKEAEENCQFLSRSINELNHP